VVTIETTAVHHTTDFGTTWEPQDILTIRDFFDVFARDADNAWICGRVGVVYHTTDAGQTWDRQNLGGPKFATRIRFADENHGWAAGGEAILLHTSDGGEVWEMSFFPNPPYPSDTVDFQGLWLQDANTGWLVAGRFPEGDTFAFGQGNIVRTTDGGANWDLQRKDTVFDFYDVAFHDAETGVVVGGEDRSMNGVVLRTTDAGATWSEVALPVGAMFLRSVKLVGDHLGWACGRNGTIIHTTDAGRTWTRQATGVDTTLFDIDFADSLHGMVAGNSVLLVTTDGGQTWFRGLGGVTEPGGRSASVRSLVRVLTNPSVGRVAFALDRPGSTRLAIYDAVGRPVHALAPGQLHWDGRDALGREVAAGTYLARTTGAEAGLVRFVLLR
jgi:photosystem II stability/assembly factor-like uncharacterized protein